MTDDIAEVREDLAAAYRLADRYGLSEGICNHLTLAVPDRDDRFLLIPYGMHWSEVTASSLLVVDRDGDKVEGEGSSSRPRSTSTAPSTRRAPRRVASCTRTCPTRWPCA